MPTPNKDHLSIVNIWFYQALQPCWFLTGVTPFKLRQSMPLLKLGAEPMHLLVDWELEVVGERKVEGEATRGRGGGRGWARVKRWIIIFNKTNLNELEENIF